MVPGAGAVGAAFTRVAGTFGGGASHDHDPAAAAPWPSFAAAAAAPAAAAELPQAVVEAPGGQAGGRACAAAAAAGASSAAPRALLGSGPCLGTPKAQSIHYRIEVGSAGIRMGIGIGPRGIGV